jgi:hypothetical protein
MGKLLRVVELASEQAIRSSETPVLTRSTRRHIPEDGVLRVFTLFHPITITWTHYTFVVSVLSIMVQG